jgi:hyperosmotically inducible periplasmic protein
MSRMKLRWGRISALLALIAVLAAGGYYAYAYGFGSIWNAVSSVGGASSDAATSARVRTALNFSKGVSPYPITVDTSGGVVTLTGTVPSQEAKALAGSIAHDTEGVKDVKNEIAVNAEIPMSADAARVFDLDIRAEVETGLARSPELKDQKIAVAVNKRVVTLSGSVDTSVQKTGAEQVARAVDGVESVDNQIQAKNTEPVPDPASTAKPPEDDTTLSKRVEFEMFRTEAIDLAEVKVAASKGEVTITGSVPTKAERLLAERIARDVAGVTGVVNQLSVKAK